MEQEQRIYDCFSFRHDILTWESRVTHHVVLRLKARLNMSSKIEPKLPKCRIELWAEDSHEVDKELAYCKGVVVLGEPKARVSWLGKSDHRPVRKEVAGWLCVMEPGVDEPPGKKLRSRSIATAMFGLFAAVAKLFGAVDLVLQVDDNGSGGLVRYYSALGLEETHHVEGQAIFMQGAAAHLCQLAPAHWLDRLVPEGFDAVRWLGRHKGGLLRHRGCQLGRYCKLTSRLCDTPEPPLRAALRNLEAEGNWDMHHVPREAGSLQCGALLSSHRSPSESVRVQRLQHVTIPDQRSRTPEPSAFRQSSNTKTPRPPAERISTCHRGPESPLEQRILRTPEPHLFRRHELAKASTASEHSGNRSFLHGAPPENLSQTVEKSQVGRDRSPSVGFSLLASGRQQHEHEAPSDHRADMFVTNFGQKSGITSAATGFIGQNGHLNSSKCLEPSVFTTWCWEAGYPSGAQVCMKLRPGKDRKRCRVDVSVNTCEGIELVSGRAATPPSRQFLRVLWLGRTGSQPVHPSIRGQRMHETFWSCEGHRGADKLDSGGRVTLAVAVLGVLAAVAVFLQIDVVSLQHFDNRSEALARYLSTFGMKAQANAPQPDEKAVSCLLLAGPAKALAHRCCPIAWQAEMVQRQPSCEAGELGCVDTLDFGTRALVGSQHHDALEVPKRPRSGTAKRPRSGTRATVALHLDSFSQSQASSRNGSKSDALVQAQTSSSFFWARERRVS